MKPRERVLIKLGNRARSPLGLAPLCVHPQDNAKFRSGGAPTATHTITLDRFPKHLDPTWSPGWRVV